jgi:hypothetical protein
MTDEKEIIDAYRIQCRKALSLRASALLLFIFCLLLFAASNPLHPDLRTPLQGMLLAAAGFLILPGTALFVFSLTVKRCPACRSQQAVGGNVRFCPNCGVRLRIQGATASRTARTREMALAGRPDRGVPAAEMTVADEDFPAENYPKKIRPFTTKDEMELTRRYIRLIDRDVEGQPEEEGDSTSDGAREIDRESEPLLRRLLKKISISPAEGTPGESLYRDIGLWAGFFLTVSFVTFFFHLPGILRRETALEMIFALFPFSLGGAVFFFFFS